MINIKSMTGLFVKRRLSARSPADWHDGRAERCCREKARGQPALVYRDSSETGRQPSRFLAAAATAAARPLNQRRRMREDGLSHTIDAGLERWAPTKPPTR